MLWPRMYGSHSSIVASMLSWCPGNMGLILWRSRIERGKKLTLAPLLNQPKLVTRGKVLGMWSRPAWYWHHPPSAEWSVKIWVLYTQTSKGVKNFVDFFFTRICEDWTLSFLMTVSNITKLFLWNFSIKAVLIFWNLYPYLALWLALNKFLGD